MSNGAYPGYSSSFRRHSISPVSFGYNQPTLAPAYGRTLNQFQHQSPYPYSIVQYSYPVPQVTPAGYSTQPASGAYTPQMAPDAYSPSISPGLYTPQFTPYAYTPQITPYAYSPQTAPFANPPALAQAVELTGVKVSTRGLEAILIAILILVALDLIIVRPYKYSASTQ